MFKKLFSRFNDQSKTIASAAVIIGGATLASKLLGVLRDRVLAGSFGAGKTLDIYYASFRIPDLIFNLLVLGTLSAGFIPVFSDYLKENVREAWKLVNTVVTLMLTGLMAVSIILLLYTPVLMKWLTPGFSQDDIAIAVKVTRIMFLSPIFLGISGIFGSVLQTFKRFFVYSLAPIMYNIGIIIGAIFLAPKFGIYGLAWGVVIGAAMHMLIQWPLMHILGFRPKWIFDINNSGVWQMARLMTPRFLGLALSQINFVIITVIGSTLSSGSISVFNFANNLQSVPLGLFAISFAIAAFPTLSEESTDKKKFIESFSLTMRQILFFIIPSSLIFLILRAQIVRVTLGAGLFDWHDTILTMDTLAFFILSLFAQGLIPLISRAFYALKDSTTPFIVGLMCAGLNIFFSIIFVKFSASIGFYGREVVALAFAFSLSNILNLLVLWLLLKIRLGELDEVKIFYSSIKISFAALCMGLAIQGLKYAIEPFVGTTTFVGIALQGIVSGLLGAAVYVAVCFLLKSEEAILFFSSVRKKMFKKYTPTETVES